MGAHLTGWRISAGDEHLVFDANGNRIADIACGGLSGRSFDEASDVARLIAAAPDLLAVLEALRDRGHTEATWFLAKKAIAKARGEIS